ncbi:hypothetical protein TSOC_005260, partial [Tetrabaena socialis]
TRPRHSGPRGSSEFGNSDLYASASGADDDYEATDHEVDLQLQMVGRHYSFHPSGPARDRELTHSGTGEGGSHSSRGSGGARHSMRLPAEAVMSMRLAEEDDFMQRLQQNRASWKDRSRGGSMAHHAPAAGSSGGGAPVGRSSEPQYAQLSPSRLSISHRHDRSGSGGPGSGGVAAVASEALEHNSLQLGSPQLHAQSE